MFKEYFLIVFLMCFVVSLLPLSGALKVTQSALAATLGDNPAEHFDLTYKWTGIVYGGGEALLTADVRSDFGEEVFHAGGPAQPNSTAGSVTCLSGQTGVQIWQRTIYGIGNTATMQMSDVDRDGVLEIIVTLQAPAGLYILRATDGNTLWYAPGVYNGSYGYFTPIGGRIDGSGVVGDTDGDDYPDIFIGVMAYEELPTTGKLIHYEWDPEVGTIVERGRIQVWHPCAGGLSLADTDNDGVFELYMNERDAYFGDGSWGRGITSFWADNLSKRWSVYDWGASSNIPMLADVNNDGIVDVVTTNLGSGICVLNSTNGNPLTIGGKTLFNENLGTIHAHYQSTVYDIDGDGHLELICADGSHGNNGTQVWDLSSWTKDVEINSGYSFRGPSVGGVTADGRKEMIIVTFDPLGIGNGTVAIYNQSYKLIDLYAGIAFRGIGSVVQDVDFDGFNELLVLTQSGKIYCLDTPGPSQQSLGLPRARSEVHFYSESRLGASEYVPYDRPWPEVISINPGSNAVNVSTQLSQLSFTLNHPLGQTMSYTLTTTPNIGSGSSTGISNGLETVPLSGSLAPSVFYRWHLSVTDESGHTTNKDFWFTTAPVYANRPPSQGTPLLNSTNGGGMNLGDLTCYNQTTNDPNGDRVTNIYNWVKNGAPYANLNLPFDSKPDSNAMYSGMAVTRDYSGLGNNGTVFGATWTQGRVGGAFSFGGNDFIRVEEKSDSLDGGGSWPAMSIGFWVKASTTGSQEKLIWKPDRYSSDWGSYEIDFQYSSGSLTFTWKVNTTASAGQFYSVSYQTNNAVTAWHHVVCTYKSGVGLIIYFDGVQAKTNLSPSLVGNITSTDGALEIAFNSGSDFVGVLDEVHLYSLQVSSTFVNQLYQDTSDGLSTKSTIPGVETTTNDVWMCQVTPNDGLADGLSSTSNIVVQSLRIRTLDWSGNILPSCTVNVAGLGSLTSDSNGWANFTNVSKETYNISVNWQGSKVAQTTVVISYSNPPVDIRCHVWNLTINAKDNTGALLPFSNMQIYVTFPNSTHINPFNISSKTWRVQNGTYYFSVKWQGGWVYGNTSVTLDTSTANRDLLSKVYSLSFRFLDSTGNNLYANPSSFALIAPNGTITNPLNPLQSYLIQNGTATWQSIIWQGTNVVPSPPSSFNTANGNPTISCQIYGLKLKNKDNFGNLLTQDIVLTFPNMTSLAKPLASGWINMTQVQKGTISFLTPMVSSMERYVLLNSTTITLTSSKTFNEIWRHDFKINIGFKDNSGIQTLAKPSSYTIQMSNGSSVSNPSDNSWISAGSLTLTSVIWQGSNVLPTIRPTNTVNMPQTYYFNIGVYIVTFNASQFKDRTGNTLLTPPSTFRLITPNGTTTQSLSLGSYQLQNGTFTLKNIMWNGSDATPSPNPIFNPASENPSISTIVGSDGVPEFPTIWIGIILLFSLSMVIILLRKRILHAHPRGE
ncbi:MAG: hypothetical protein QG670_522 [Thermoproteota archaeon]|nr:hypothetical protein [Thermoproteota archaeon]